MQNKLASPIICAANRCACALKFVNLKALSHHPYLTDEEKALWIWLATTSTNDVPFSCSWNCEQISLMLNKSTRIILRNLFRLMLMGFLKCNTLPIKYGQLTREIETEVHHLKLLIPIRPIGPECNPGTIWPKRSKPLTINLLS
ncbi:MAG: hypothetical protein JSS07_11995 [Proteobacteria bacterium]|nr:hypothetical protein [Pseudomonadota bacterium]